MEGIWGHMSSRKGSINLYVKSSINRGPESIQMAVTLVVFLTYHRKRLTIFHMVFLLTPKISLFIDQYERI